MKHVKCPKRSNSNCFYRSFAPTSLLHDQIGSCLNFGEEIEGVLRATAERRPPSDPIPTEGGLYSVEAKGPKSHGRGPHESDKPFNRGIQHQTGAKR
ncbi:hypothetical protein ES703_51601 [subsurface metagenome]